MVPKHQPDIYVYSFHKKKKSKAPTNTSWIFWERFQSYSNGKVTSKKESESRSDMTLWRKKPSSEDKRDITDSLFTFFGGKQFSNDDKVW